MASHDSRDRVVELQIGMTGFAGRTKKGGAEVTEIPELELCTSPWEENPGTWRDPIPPIESALLVYQVVPSYYHPLLAVELTSWLSIDRCAPRVKRDRASI